MCTNATLGAHCHHRRRNTQKHLYNSPESSGFYLHSGNRVVKALALYYIAMTDATRTQRLVKLLGLDGKPLDSDFLGDNAKIIAAVKQHRADLVRATTDAEMVQISQWLPVAQSISATDLTSIDQLLYKQTYLAGQYLSLADVMIYDAVASSKLSVDNTSNVRRWYSHVAALCGVQDSVMKSPTLLPVFPKEAAPKKEAKESKGESTGKTAPAAPAAPAAAPSSGDKKANDAAAGAGGAGGEKPQKEKKEKAPAAPAPAPAAAADELDPSKLDIRVGQIMQCVDHADADKLLCSHIDVGEESQRTIASGLRLFYKAEEMVGKKVLVLANLKDRNMVGFKSQGMVLCACNADHSAVKLVQPPADAAPGDRVTFPGFTGEPASAAQVAKKKILEKLAPQLRTDEKGVAHWGSSAFSVGSGVCTSELVSGTVS